MSGQIDYGFRCDKCNLPTLWVAYETRTPEYRCHCLACDWDYQRVPCRFARETIRELRAFMQDFGKTIAPILRSLLSECQTHGRADEWPVGEINKLISRSVEKWSETDWSFLDALATHVDGLIIYKDGLPVVDIIESEPDLEKASRVTEEEIEAWDVGESTEIDETIAKIPENTVNTNQTGSPDREHQKAFWNVP